MTRHTVVIACALLMTLVIADAAQAVYHPTLGRFTQRDPNGMQTGPAAPRAAGGPAVSGGFMQRDVDLQQQYADGMNLYQYVRSNPLGYNDPSGLYTLQDARNAICEERWEYTSRTRAYTRHMRNCRKNLGQQEVFSRWADMESNNTDWLSTLPECPSKIRIVNGNPCDCTTGDWDSIGEADQQYHPTAKWEMRSDNHLGHGQQCTYDDQGDLITSGLGAGTPGFRSASFWNGVYLRHYYHDVEPFNVAWDLDGGVLDDNLRRYLEARPPSQGGGKCY